MSYAHTSQPRQAGNAIDALLFRVLALPPSQLAQLLEKLVGRPQVAAAGWHIAERRLSPRPHAARDARMVRLHDGGLSYADIARAYHLKPRTVARACQRFRRQKGDSESLSPSCSA